ncbi:MAG TPA: hypothetical protein VFI47_09325 [Acidimicrobiales bacterium]|nr:hypothetical protein [Acidimicrobiales bacterium]
MARTIAPRSRVDAVLRQVQRQGVTRGVYGSSRVWFWVAVSAFVARRLRRAAGSEPDLVYRGELRAGEVLHIAHKPETYEGKRVRSRRRRISA